MRSAVINFTSFPQKFQNYIIIVGIQPGRLKAVKALGWYLEEQDLAQVSMNLTDYEVTPLHVAFEECSKDAKVQCDGSHSN